jgi:hypothetical protein
LLAFAGQGKKQEQHLILLMLTRSMRPYHVTHGKQYEAAEMADVEIRLGEQNKPNSAKE